MLRNIPPHSFIYYYINIFHDYRLLALAVGRVIDADYHTCTNIYMLNAYIVSFSHDLLFADLAFVPVDT